MSRPGALGCEQRFDGFARSAQTNGDCSTVLYYDDRTVEKDRVLGQRLEQLVLGDVPLVEAEFREQRFLPPHNAPDRYIHVIGE